MKSLRQWQNEIANWGDKTFHHDDVAGSLNGCIRHLKMEVEELDEAVRYRGLSNDAADECADIFILLCSICRLLNIDLLKAVIWKMGVNRKRRWHEPDAHGVVQHKEAK